jgi:hypothetical protein
MTIFYIKVKKELTLLHRHSFSITIIVLPLNILFLGEGMITLLPFVWKDTFVSNFSLLCSHLGPTHSQRITLPVKPFSTSVFGVLTQIVATTTKIGTKGRFS